MKQAVVDYVNKPVRPEKLYEVVRQHAKGHFYKDQLKTLQATEKPFRRSRTSLACTAGIRGEHHCRMLKKAAQQGRSKRGSDAYSIRYGEAPLSKARTKLADFFSILLGV
jgi:hypothetical protein